MLTDGRTDDGRKVITIAHPEQSSGELKILMFEAANQGLADGQKVTKTGKTYYQFTIPFAMFYPEKCYYDIQSNFNGWNPFRTMKTCSRHR